MKTSKPIPPDLTEVLGIFANAFRVAQDEIEVGECLLEFLVYSQTEDLARVVGRVQVKKGLLPVIRDQITEVL